MQGVAAKNDASYDLSARIRDRSDHHRCLYCDDVPAERPHRDARLPGTDTVAFREVLPYLSLEPFRPCWYTQFLVALKESALPAPAGPTDVVYRFLNLPTFRPAISVRIERRDSIQMTVSQTEGWGGLRSERPRIDANRSVAIAGLGLIGTSARCGPLLVGYRAGRTRRARRIAVDSEGRPDRPACSSGSLEPAKSVPTRPSAGRATISWVSRTSRQTRATEGAI